MNESFFQLSANDQRDILTAAESLKGISAKMLEKDIWICWILEKLFLNFDGMVFKGGTSLSKGYDVIQRFSEDIDITIDPSVFGEKINVDEITNTQAKKARERLRESLLSYLCDEIKPSLTNLISAESGVMNYEVRLNEEKETIEIFYQSVLPGTVTSGYLLDHVLLEFGSRNSIEPNKDQELTCIIEDITDNVALPRARVKMLSIARTFWEKAALIHVECNRARLIENPSRMSRHWYDLVKIMDSRYYNECINDECVFDSVIKYKEKFYRSPHYAACRIGDLRLVPDNKSCEGLKDDYNKMIDAGMIYRDTLSYNELIEKIQQLEKELNERIASFSS